MHFEVSDMAEEWPFSHDEVLAGIERQRSGKRNWFKEIQWAQE